MRDDVLKQAGQLKDITNVIVLTHNIDFIFLQSVFMTAIKQCGHPSLTIFADAQCAQQTFRYQSRLLSGLGRRFRVVPVVMPTGFRFHPKALLFSGPEQAVLFVGSGNLTFGGMRENAEVWTRFETENNEGEAFNAFRDYLADALRLVALPDAVQADVDAAFEAKNHTWAESLPTPGLLYGRAGQGPSLLDRVVDDFGGEGVDRLIVCTPYFDAEASALVELSERLGNPPTQVLVQDRRSTLFKEAADNLPSHIKLNTVSYRRKKGDENSGTRFIHAKFYALQQGDQVTVYSGSANCSIAALRLAGDRGNAELLTKRVLSEEEYEKQYLGEFELIEEPPELARQEDQPEESDDEKPVIRLMAARFDAGELLVGYRAPGDVKITKCMLDGQSVDFRMLENNEVVVRLPLSPTRVFLEGSQAGQAVISNIHWVDDEDQLRSTARGRSLIESIQRSERAGGWHLDDWSMIVGLLVKDMEYVSPREMMHAKSRHDEINSGKKMTFSYADVFSSNYDAAPTLPKNWLLHMGRSSFSIYKLLLNAYGVDIHQGQQTEDGMEESEGEKLSSFVMPNEGDEVVDAPEELNTKDEKTQKQERELKVKDRKRITQLFEMITETLTNPVYLETRDPIRLGVDLQVVALLMRKAYSKGWVSSEQFFNFTQKVWSMLFFNSEVERGRGWLEYRYLHSDSPENFINEISTPSLSAALFSWADAMPVADVGPYMARFMVAQCLSMGRMQWLWHNQKEDSAEVLKQIVSIIKDSPCGISSQDNDEDDIYTHRIDLLRKGEALRRLEDLLGTYQVDDIRARVVGYPTRKGELLWQGKRGICIAQQDVEEGKKYVPVLCLQDPEGKTGFQKEYLIPLRALLKSEILPDTDGFGPAQREVLSKLIGQLEVQSGAADTYASEYTAKNIL